MGQAIPKRPKEVSCPVHFGLSLARGECNFKVPEGDEYLLCRQGHPPIR
jgi:hypothetical protein